MGRLTRYGKTSHENSVCCTHFGSKECHEVTGNCAIGCKWEEEAWSKLAHYEDLEEQGLLLKLPCKVGDVVYSVESGGIKDFTVTSFGLMLNRIYAYHGFIFVGEIGFSAFLTKEEAEKALEEMKGE